MPSASACPSSGATKYAFSSVRSSVIEGIRLATIGRPLARYSKSLIGEVIKRKGFSRTDDPILQLLFQFVIVKFPTLSLTDHVSRRVELPEIGTILGSKSQTGYTNDKLHNQQVEEQCEEGQANGFHAAGFSRHGKKPRKDNKANKRFSRYLNNPGAKFTGAIFLKRHHNQILRPASDQAMCCNRGRSYFLGSANSVTVGFPPTISGIVSFRRTPPSPEVTATY